MVDLLPKDYWKDHTKIEPEDAEKQAELDEIKRAGAKAIRDQEKKADEAT